MIDVWFAHATVVREADLALLDADELAHLGSLRRSDERASYVAGHALLRRAVGAALGADPAGIEFGRSCLTCGSTDHGKPFATAHAALAFSISRTRTMVGVAVGGDHPLGLDLEAFDAVPVGAAELVGLPADSSTEDVARQWVRVEAVLKASGAGLSIPPDAVRLTGPDAAPRLLSWPFPDAAGVHVADLASPSGFAAALAVIGGNRPTIAIHRGNHEEEDLCHSGAARADVRGADRLHGRPGSGRAHQVR